MTVHVNDNCIGCGLCANTCKFGAINIDYTEEAVDNIVNRLEDLIEIIEQSNNINQNNLNSKTIIKDEYSNNKNIPGEYIIELNYDL